MQIKAPPKLWYHQPGHLRIKLQPSEVEISPMGHDAVIIKEINGNRLEALVPTHTLGVENGSVPVAYAGRNGEYVVLHLPTSNEGRATWEIRETDLEFILESNSTV